MKLVR